MPPVLPPKYELPPSVAAALGAVAPRLGVILGSGLGGVADSIDVIERIPYRDLPHAPEPAASVAGHEGAVLVGRMEGRGIVAFCGRFHSYQGLSAFDVTWPVRLAHAMGVSVLCLTNACGGLRDGIDPGGLHVIRDHINLTGSDPLSGVGWSDGIHFVSMGDAWDAELRATATQALEAAGAYSGEVVYAALPGPTFETAAEVARLRGCGADVVGMSTVHEAIMARALGMRIVGVSRVTNRAGAVSLSHADVLALAGASSSPLSATLLAILRSL